MGHNYAGTEHILLGLIEFEAGTGPLSTLSVDPQQAREKVKLILGRLLTVACQVAASVRGV